jgi:hypothetical protein
MVRECAVIQALAHSDRMNHPLEFPRLTPFSAFSRIPYMAMKLKLYFM